MLKIPNAIAFLMMSILLAPAAVAAAPPENGQAKSADQEAASAEDDGGTLQQQLRQPGKTEGLQKPATAARRNLEEAQPALVNPCRTSPAPSWCGDQ
jgi:hypothetical protein